MERITSNSNSRIVRLGKLVKSAKMRKEEDAYIVEGVRMCSEIPLDRLYGLYISEEMEKLYDSSELYRDVRALVEYAEKKGICYVVSEQCMKKASGTENPQGILAEVRMKYYLIEHICGDSDSKTCILILDRLQDPGNMGTIIRTAEGAGISGIMVSSDSVDIYSPKVVRSTMGSLFRVPIYISSDMVSDIECLKKKGIVIYGTHLDGVNLYQEKLEGPMGFLIGNEGAGLSDAVAETADRLIRIPMEGNVESLNAAISAAVVSYEALRQRISNK